MKGLLYGDSGQLVASIIGIAVNVVSLGSAAYVGLWVVNMLVGNRVSEESEIEGLDEGETFCPATPPRLATLFRPRCRHGPRKRASPAE